LPLRVGQEIQALPRRAGLTALSPRTTRSEAERALAEAFAASGFEDAAREARLTLRASENVSAAAWLAEPDAPLSDPARAEAFAERRLSGEPLSRILGRREFWSLDLALSPAVLDPRPDTETLVEAALAAVDRSRPLRVLDFGVGSGAILAALLSELPNATGVGVDVSAEAAATARANLERFGLGARAQIVVSDWDAALGDAAFDLIVSNPPYIPSADIVGLAPEVRDHDPRLALDGGADGLDAYRALAPIIARRLAPEGWFVLEFGGGQGDTVSALLGNAGLAPTRRHADLGGIERCVGGRLRRGDQAPRILSD
jgi:release factor glutamine methyltransferase